LALYEDNKLRRDEEDEELGVSVLEWILIGVFSGSGDTLLVASESPCLLSSNFKDF
jgi:hypothetical protein